MLEFKNTTGFAGTFFTAPDPQGVDSIYALLKGTFALDRGLAPCDEQVPPAMATEHFGEPLTSSIRVASDASLRKPATDVLLIGHAHAPAGRPTWQMDVSVRIGPVAKTVRVFGDRRWQVGPGGAAMSWVAPFERVPLVWERAYGGSDETDNGPAADPRNPVGVGFHARHGAKAVDGAPLPNVEDPSALITSWRDTPPPAGFAPLASHWEPRASYAGTYDAAWQRSRAPFLPADFDPRFFQLSPPGLVCPGYLHGGEPVDIRGATPSGALTFSLPSCRPKVTFVVDNRPEVRPAYLDTVTIQPDDARVILVWRAVLACDKKLLRVREIRAEPEESA